MAIREIDAFAKKVLTPKNKLRDALLLSGSDISERRVKFISAFLGGIGSQVACLATQTPIELKVTALAGALGYIGTRPIVRAFVQTQYGEAIDQQNFKNENVEISVEKMEPTISQAKTLGIMAAVALTIGAVTGLADAATPEPVRSAPVCNSADVPLAR